MIEEIEDRVRQRAHLIWEREGRPSGRAEAHWAMAEAEIAAESAKPSKPRAARKAPVARASATNAADSTVVPIEAAAAPNRRKGTPKGT